MGRFPVDLVRRSSGYGALAAAFATALLIVAANVLAFIGLAPVAAVVSVAALGGVGLVWRLGNLIPDAQLGARLARQVEEGRRSVIYDYDTGLLADWYLRIRLAEECARASRYDRDLSLVVIAVDRESETVENEANLVEWLRRKQRATDLAGCLGSGRYLIALPDTDAEGAGVVVQRLDGLADIASATAHSPSDGTCAEDLLQAAEDRLTKRVREGQPVAAIRQGGASP